MYHFINDNFNTDIATVPPSYKMKHFHEHNRWELMFIYSGSCTLYVGEMPDDRKTILLLT